MNVLDYSAYGKPFQVVLPVGDGQGTATASAMVSTISRATSLAGLLLALVSPSLNRTPAPTSSRPLWKP